jgi:VWFA-related protein
VPLSRRSPVLLTALTLVLLGTGAPAADQSAFRTGVNFVRIDAFATVNGAPVRDLTANDFEVSEDGAPQRVETFERVEAHGRLFVLFLDTYHVDLGGARRLQKTLLALLERVVGPDDTYAVMTPEMSAADLTLTPRTSTIESYLSKYWFWGDREQLYPEDPIEQKYQECYPEHSEKRCETATGSTTQPDDFYQGVAEALVARRHEKRTLASLTDLSRYLQSIRQGRKAVLVVSDGWALYRPDQSLLRVGPCDISRGQTRSRGVGDPGDSRERRAMPFMYSGLTCDTDRQALATLDDRQAFQGVIDAANRANVSFYPLDSRSLSATTTAGGASAPQDPLRGAGAPVGGGGALAPRNAQLRTRTEPLRTLASETDGFAVLDPGDLDPGLKRAVDDLTSYYLLGYASSNAKLDGTARSISVRVKRPGVDVRARRGYRAATADEAERGRSTSTASPNAPASQLQLALTSLDMARPGVPLRTAVGYATIESAAGTGTRVHAWAQAELDAVTARQGAWLGGGTVEVTIIAPDGTSLMTRTATLNAGERSLTVDVGEVAAQGELAVRTRISPQLEGASLTDTVRVSSVEPGGHPLLMRRGPTTGLNYRPTAAPLFQRTERLRVDLPVAPGAEPPKAEVLDRMGQPMAVPVRTVVREENGMTWASAEVTLAPLAPGDYLIRLAMSAGGKAYAVLTSFRMVP